MQRRDSPWRWPVAAALAGLLLATAVFLVPSSWYNFLFAGRRLEPVTREVRPWLVLLPPPDLQPATAEVPPSPQPGRRTPEALPADWWTRAWRVRVADDVARAVRPTPEDSSRVLLQAVGLPVDLAMLARPDSVLAARIILMQREDALHFAELEPYFHAMARAAMYRDLQSRVAFMYDDFLRQEVIVPK